MEHLTFDVFSCYRFVCKNNGVLFENQLLQIGIKSEYRQNLGKVTLELHCESPFWYLDHTFLPIFTSCGTELLESRCFTVYVYDYFHKAQTTMMMMMMVMWLYLSQGECTYFMATRHRCSLPVSALPSAVQESCSLISFYIQHLKNISIGNLPLFAWAVG